MMKQMLAAAAMIAVLGSFGCSKGDDRAVVARVGQTKITVGDYKRQLEGLENFQMEQAVATDAAARKEFLEDLIGIELVLQEAKRQGLDKDADYKKTMDAIKKEYDETKQRLEKRYREAGRNELFKVVLKKELADRAAKLDPPTDKEISDFYVKNREKMITMDGKRIPLKDVAPQIKNRLLQEKQRDLYLAYIKGLREKANVKVEEKVLDAMASSLSVTATLQVPQLTPETGAKQAPAEGGAAKTK
jgi:hypothetical protein